MSASDFYRAFEERYRGSRELIQERLRVYVPYIQPLRQLYPLDPCAIDLGCGRGEWLELLQVEGFAAQGVDLDEGMLAACHALSLPALRGDALEYLGALADASQAVVSGFHIAEHIAFADLQTLVSEALRVLKPGGLLILETPNPENIVVGSNSFYLDPTHKSPLPSKLLSFLAEHYGFARVKVLRLQQAKGLDSARHIQIIDVLAGVSPDYAVVAQKSASLEQMQIFDAAFDTAHGVDLETLAQRFDERLPPHFMQEEFIGRIETHINASLTPLLGELRHAERSRQTAEERTLALEECARAAQGRAQVTEERLHAAEERAQAAHAHAIAIGVERDALRASLSWRITAPLRGVAKLASRPAQSLCPLWTQAEQKVFQGSQWLLAPLMRKVLKNSRLSYRVNQILMRYPSVYQYLLAVARRSGVITDLSAQGIFRASVDQQGTQSFSTLTPEARAIYAHLKAAAGNNGEQH